MQGTADLHHEIADAVLPQPHPVFDDPTALDAAVDMLDPQPTLVQRLIGPLLLQRELLATGLLRRHEDRHLRERERQEPQILQEPAPRRQGIRRRVRNGLIMGAAAIGVAQEEDEKQGVDEQDIFYCMVLFLAALTRFLFSSVLGADDAPFGAVMGKSCYVESARGLAERDRKNEKILSRTLSTNLLKGRPHGRATLLYPRTYLRGRRCA